MTTNTCEWCDVEYVFSPGDDCFMPQCECLTRWCEWQDLLENRENNLFEKEFDR